MLIIKDRFSKKIWRCKDAEEFLNQLVNEDWGTNDREEFLKSRKEIFKNIYGFDCRIDTAEHFMEDIASAGLIIIKKDK